MEYYSRVTIEAKSVPGVRLTIARISFGRRLELTRRIWELVQRVEFAGAGHTAADRLEAALASGEIDRIYVEWGLAGIEGLTIDGEMATPESLAARGPESLFREAAAAIKAECGLTEEERKNS